MLLEESGIDVAANIGAVCDGDGVGVMLPAMMAFERISTLLPISRLPLTLPSMLAIWEFRSPSRMESLSMYALSLDQQVALDGGALDVRIAAGDVATIMPRRVASRSASNLASDVAVNGDVGECPDISDDHGVFRVDGPFRRSAGNRQNPRLGLGAAERLISSACRVFKVGRSDQSVWEMRIFMSAAASCTRDFAPVPGARLWGPAGVSR